MAILRVHTVNHKYFVVKMFSDSQAYAKYELAKTCTINGNAVQGLLSENCLAWNIIAQNILSTKYS